MAAEERHARAHGGHDHGGGGSDDEELQHHHEEDHQQEQERSPERHSQPSPTASHLRLMGQLFAELAHFNGRVAHMLASVGMDESGALDQAEEYEREHSAAPSNSAAAAAAFSQSASAASTRAHAVPALLPSRNGGGVKRAAGPRAVQHRRPTKSRPASVLFDVAHRPRFVAAHPALSFAGVSKLVADAWLHAPHEERARFEAMARDEAGGGGAAVEEHEQPQHEEQHHKRRRFDPPQVDTSSASAFVSAHAGALPSPLEQRFSAAAAASSPPHSASSSSVSIHPRIVRPAPLQIASTSELEDSASIQLIEETPPLPQLPQAQGETRGR